MYPQMPWELVSDPLGSVEHTWGASALKRPSRIQVHPAPYTTGTGSPYLGSYEAEAEAEAEV